MRARAGICCSVAVALLGCQLFVDTGEPEDASIGDGASDAGLETGDARSSVDAAGSGDSGDSALEGYRAVVTGDKPIAYFPLDEDGGAVQITDVVGGKVAIVFSGATLGEPGIAGTAASFPGTGDDWISAGDNFDFVNRAPFSIECWMRPVLEHEGVHVALWKASDVDDGYGIYALRLAGAAHVVFYMGQATDASHLQVPLPFDAGDAPPDSGIDAGWSHVVATFDGTLMTIFVNGVPEASHEPETHPTDSVQPFRIGRLFRGAIDEVAVYDRALTAAQVQAHHRAAPAR